MRTFSTVVVCIAILILTGHCSAQTQLVSDNFTGTNGTYLGSNWTGCGFNYGAYSKLVYQNGAAGGSGYWSQDCVLYTGYGAFPADQYATATVVAPTPSSTKQASIELRGNAKPNTNEAYIACGWDAQDFPADYHYRIWSLTPGAPGPVSLWLSTITPATNDVISCQVLGNTVSMKLNGHLVQAVTDTSGINSGYPGLYYIDPNGTGPTSTDIIFDNFLAGSGPSVVSTTINPEDATIPAGFFLQYSGTISYADGSIATPNNWSTSNNAVATIDITGTAYGVSQGTAMLTGSSGPDGVTTAMNVEAPDGYTPLVYDTFVGSDGSYLGSNWAGCSYSGGVYSELVYQNNQAGGSGYWSQDCSLYIGYGSFPNDQYATAMVVDPSPSSTSEASVELRSTATSGMAERYIACGWDAQDFHTDQHYRIWSLAPRGTPVSLFLSTITPMTNDVIWCQVLGSEVTMQVNGTLVAVVKDTSGLTSGYPGMFYIDPYGTPPLPTDVIFDNFGAGQIDNAVAAAITVSPSISTITGNSTLQYTATGTFTDGTVSNVTTSSSWSSSNTSVATINSNGLATGVGPGTVTITATDGTVTGKASLTVQYITPTVTFTGAPASAAYNTSFAVTATTNASTMPQIAGTSGVCTVGPVSGTPANASALVTMISGSGTCTLTATWAADSKYTSPSPLTQNTTAVKASANLTLTTTSISVPYGSTIPNIQSNYTLTGFIGTDTQATVCTGSPTLSTSATNTSLVGAYPITAVIGTLTCTSANVTYTTTIVNSGNVNITKATTTITWVPAPIAYGQGLTAAQLDAQGFDGSTNVSADGTFAYTYNSNTITIGTVLPFGSDQICVIFTPSASYSADLSTSAQYCVTESVTVALLTINATHAATAVYNTPVPNSTFTFTLTGFIGNDSYDGFGGSNSVCSGQPTLSTSAVQGSDVGIYTINVNAPGFSCIGYTFAVNTGELHITPATLTIIPVATSVTYNSQVQPYSYSCYFGATYLGTNSCGGSPYTITGVPTITTSATVRASSTPGVVYYTSNVGQYSMKTALGSLKALVGIQGYSDYNFAFSTIANALTITTSPQSLTVQPNNITVKQSTCLSKGVPTQTYKITGLLNWDTQASTTTGTPTLSDLSYSGGCTLGTYTIQSAAGTLMLDQYSGQTDYSGINYGTATLTID